LAILIFNLFKIVHFKLPPKLVAKETHIDDLVMWYVQTTTILPMIITTQIFVLLFTIIIVIIIILSLQLYLLSTIILRYIPELS
jgi:hypothetical protein